MSNAVEDFLHALKRTINGDPYPDPSRKQYAPVRYRIASLRDLREGILLSGKYLIQNRIGKGAMATVYKAVQQPIDRVVAIKILNTRYSQDPVNVKRFNREAKTLSNLKHRNILSIQDLGATDDGQPFLVMEYLDGITLEGLIAKRGAIPIARAIPLFCQVCEGMAYAHKRGLIHRDLKPGNVMVIKDEEDGSDLAKLVDFGIVKVDPNSQNVSQKLTQKGEVWGSPVYMSPEQCMGNELDARSDVYSFGLVMYEAVLGVPAFQGQTIGKIINKQLGEMPAFFKDVDAQLKIPEKLEEIVFRAIRKKADDRFASMDELLKELEAFARQYRIRLKGTSSTKLNSEYYRTISEPSPPKEQAEQVARPEPVLAEKSAAEQLRADAAQDAAGYESSGGISSGKIKFLIAASCAVVGLGILALLTIGGMFLLKSSAIQNHVNNAPDSAKKPELRDSLNPERTVVAKPVPGKEANNNSAQQFSKPQVASDGNSQARTPPVANAVPDSNSSETQVDKNTGNKSQTALNTDTSNDTNNKNSERQVLPKEKIKKKISTCKRPNDLAAGRSHRTASSEPSDQDLEKIYLKRRNSDNTQQWLDLKDRMDSN